MVRSLSLPCSTTCLWRWKITTSLNLLVSCILSQTRTCSHILYILIRLDKIIPLAHTSYILIRNDIWISTKHTGTISILLIHLVDHRLLILVINQHLILSILLYIKHLLLMTLREGTVLVAGNLLLWILVLILHLRYSNGCLCLIDLWWWLTVLLNEHGWVNLVAHSSCTSIVHCRLLALLHTLWSLLATILCERHSHAVLSLVLSTHHGVSIGSTLTLRYLATVTCTDSLVTPNILCVHQIAESLILRIFYLQVMRLVTNQW